MELRPGNSQTTDGAIPADWTAVRLGDIGRWFSGGTPSMANPAFWDGEIPWVSPKDMKESRLHGGIDHVSEEAIGNGTRLIPTGGLLVVVRGMILAHSFPVARVERPLAFNQDLKAVVTRDGIDSNFVLYWLLSKAQQLRRLATESTHGTKRIPTESLFRATCICPPLPEQRAIAGVLGDVDALLDVLTQLIAKKRDLKEAAMQQLLTGQNRLPAFRGKWNLTPLGSIGQMKTGPFGTLLKAHEYSGSDGTPLISVREIAEGYLRVDENTPLVPASVVQRLPGYVLHPGDIVFGRKGGVDRSALVHEGQGGWFLGSDAIRIRPANACHPPFIAYQLQRPQVQSWLQQNATGTTMPSMNQEILRRVSFLLPPLSEQTAIAAVLSDMDAELAALEHRLAKTRTLKQGMMQELLTGRIRLV